MSKTNARRLKRGAYRFLREELEFLKREGVFDDQTFDDALSRYVQPKKVDSGRRVLLATETLGALAAVVALAVFFGPELGRWLGALVTLLLSNGATIVLIGIFGATFVGEFVARRFRKEILGEALGVGAALLFGVALWRCVSVYNLSLSFAESFWIWGIAVFSTGYFAQFSTRRFLAVAILVVWFLADLCGDPSGFSLAALDDRIPNCAYSLPLFAILGYRQAVRLVEPSLQKLYFRLLVCWAAVLPFVWRDGAPWFYETFLGALVLAFGTRFATTREIAKDARKIGLFLVLTSLIPQTFTAFYPGLHSTFDNDNSGSVGVFGDSYFGVAPYCVLALAAAFFVGAKIRRRAVAKSTESTNPSQTSIFTRSNVVAALASPVGVACLTILTFLANAVVSYTALNEASGWKFALVCYANALSVALAWNLIVSGANGREDRYALGTAYFVLWLILRYVQIFVRCANVLTTGIFFLVVAFTLFVASARFAKFRRLRDAKPDGSNLPKPDESPNADKIDKVDADSDAPVLDAPTVSNEKR